MATVTTTLWGGTPYYTGSGTWSGMMRVFSGRTGDVLYSHYGGAGDEMGYAVAGIGDINRDGYADVLVGAPQDETSGVESGTVYLYLGPHGNTHSTLTGSGVGDRFGQALCGLGDLTGNGESVFAVGAPGLHRGRVEFYDRVGLIEVIDGTGDSFGSSIDGGGDLNRDGRPDFVVGDPGANQREGRASGFLYGNFHSDVDLYGSGWPGTYGVPGLTINRQPRIGSMPVIWIENSRGTNTQGFLMIGLASTDLATGLGGSLLVVPSLTLPLSFSQIGVELGFRLNNSRIVGTELFLQSLVLDPGASEGVAFSRGLYLRIGGSPN